MIAYELETIVEGDHIAIADIAVCDERVFVATASGMLVYGVGEGDRLRGGASGTQIVYDKKFSKKPVTKIEIDRRNKILFSLSGFDYFVCYCFFTDFCVFQFIEFRCSSNLQHFYLIKQHIKMVFICMIYRRGLNWCRYRALSKRKAPHSLPSTRAVDPIRWFVQRWRRSLCCLRWAEMHKTLQNSRYHSCCYAFLICQCCQFLKYILNQQKKIVSKQ